MIEKRIYRDQKNKVLAGVCGAIGEYFEIDPVIIRLIWVLVTVFSGLFPGIIIYILSIFIIPKKSA